ncbi:hypothetical protein BDW62DRAFT_199555 [Aspergillus aurantiobrunneus]
MESQLSTIDLLTAMFPSQGELEIDPSTLECIEKLRIWCEAPNPSAEPLPGIPSSILLAVHAPVTGNERRIQVNISIPLQLASQDTDPEPVPPPLNYSLRQPDWMSKADVARLSSAMPGDDIFAALEYIQTEAARFLETQTQTQTQKSSASLHPTTQPPTPIIRAWFYFPSLSTRAKRSDMVTYAPDYSLTGFVLAGKPGVLCLEGASRDIDSYMSFIKTHSWGDIPAHQKKVSERYRETEGVERVFGGMEEITDSLGERGGQRANRSDMQALEGWLKAKIRRHDQRAFLKRQVALVQQRRYILAKREPVSQVTPISRETRFVQDRASFSTYIRINPLNNLPRSILYTMGMGRQKLSFISSCCKADDEDFSSQ